MIHKERKTDEVTKKSRFGSEHNAGSVFFGLILVLRKQAPLNSSVKKLPFLLAANHLKGCSPQFPVLCGRGGGRGSLDPIWVGLGTGAGGALGGGQTEPCASAFVPPPPCIKWKSGETARLSRGGGDTSL